MGVFVVGERAEIMQGLHCLDHHLEAEGAANGLTHRLRLTGAALAGECAQLVRFHHEVFANNARHRPPLHIL